MLGGGVSGSGYDPYTPTSLSPDRTGDRTDDEMLRYEASSVEGDATHREQVRNTVSQKENREKNYKFLVQDFGYEVIEAEQRQREAEAARARWEQEAAADSEPGLNVQYRGTPERKIPSRSKRSRHRHSQEPQDQVSATYEAGEDFYGG